MAVFHENRRNTNKSAHDGQDGQQYKWNGHGRRTLMEMAFLFFCTSEFAEESGRIQPKHIKGGHPGSQYSQDPINDIF